MVCYNKLLMETKTPVSNTYDKDSRSIMIIEMEKKLNPKWFSRYARRADDFASLSIAQYWDWLTYIDVRPLLLTLFRTTTSPSSRFSK